MEKKHIIKEDAKKNEKYLNTDVSSLKLTFKDGSTAKLKTNSEEELVMVNILPNYILDNPFKLSVIQNYNIGITVTELARLCGFTCNRTFQRRFKEQFGETVYNWMLNRKMEDIHTLVVNTDLTFTHISELFQFKNPAHLTNAYKKHFGVSPTTDRQKGSDSTSEEE